MPVSIFLMLSLDSGCLVGFCILAKPSSASEAHPEVTQMRALRRVVVEKPKSLELRGFERVDRIC